MYRFLASLMCLLAVNLADGLLRGRYNRRFVNLSSGDDESIPDQWFLQKLDHSDPTNPGTWWQRYQTNDTWFKNSRNSPVFLMIGGEAAIEAIPFNGMAWMGYAETYGALCFTLEHRFYGKSQPTGDLSVKSFRYLTSEQALADVAYFIDGINQKYNFTSANKWVVFGGSYPGSLSAWARLKYPHLIHAAVSSSGPVLAQMNFKGYDEVVRQGLAASSPQCAINVHKAVLEVEDNLSKPGMAAEYSKKFNLCPPLDLKEKGDVANFIQTLVEPIQDIVQSNPHAHDGDVDELCSVMTNQTIGTVVDRYAALHRSFTQNCSDVSYHDNIVKLRTEGESKSICWRCWIYQTCTEFGWFQTSSSRDEIFGYGVNLQFLIDQCKDIFGDDFDSTRVAEGVKRTNIVYGQKDIVNHVTNVIFVHGSLDPWHGLGVYNSTNPKSPAILIEGTSHCANMYPPSSKDPHSWWKPERRLRSSSVHVYHLAEFTLLLARNFLTKPSAVICCT